ncbi:extracellular solute-binding protein [Paenibacillus nasutitermitis]|uniref:Sugar ABC transporter permease n=1 Tax=Paenibacillus nasutitermitis TaxID=1652958 RepID=A0A916YSJ9_9BACL|nr:extracellular solute-binding protein [Paenibacillus nasutitermitis]GGD59131.1 sugar ABC transporter permease [Paenibacillus nasutitermitis]
MKRKRFIVSIGIVAVTLGVILSACGDNDAANESGVQNPGQGPVSLHILNSHAGAKYAQQLKADDPYVKELNRLSGYDIKWEFLGHAQDFTQQLTVRFASKDLADMIRTTNINASMHAGAVENGIFTELGPLIDKYGPNLKKMIPQETWNSPKVSKNGKIYGIPSIVPIPASNVIYIRQDWLDKLGMKQPKTMDEWKAYFEGVRKEDLDGNGNPDDEYGLYVREDMVGGDLFFHEFGYHPSEWTLQDGQLQPGIIQPEMKEALKWWKMMYENKYVNPDLFTLKASDWLAGISNGKGGSWKYSFDVANISFSPDKFADKNAKIDLIGGPVGPTGKHGLTPRGDQVYFVWVIPTSSKKAVEAVKFLDWAWSSPEAQTFFNYGVKDLSYKVENGQIKWDKNDEVNKADGNSVWVFYQLSINPTNVGTQSPKLFELQPNKELMMKGMKVAEEEIYETDGMSMPALEAFSTKPELSPGLGNGTMFFDMFAKVVTGKEDLDAAFDKFVQEWKRRGGDEAIKEATDWYNAFHKQ